MQLKSDDTPKRVCGRCGQPIPSTSKLASKSADGKDICLACQIHEAELKKRPLQ